MPDTGAAILGYFTVFEKHFCELKHLKQTNKKMHSANTISLLSTHLKQSCINNPSVDLMRDSVSFPRDQTIRKVGRRPFINHSSEPVMDTNKQTKTTLWVYL